MSPQSDASFEAGIAAIRAGQTDVAKQHFQAALERKPNHAPTLYNLGALEYQSGQSDRAAPLLLKAAEIRPDHADTRAVLAAVLVDLNKLSEALPHVRAIVQNPTAVAEALSTAGQVLALAGRSTDAEAAYRQALAKDESYRPAGLALIALVLQRRAFKDAKAICDQLLTIDPTDQDVHLRRTQALWEGGQVAAARDALLDLLDFSPDHVTAHHNLSLFADHPDPQTPIDRLSSLLGEGVLPAQDAIKAWFAVGNLFVSLKAWEESLACFAEGNRLRATQSSPAHATSIAAFNHRVAALIKAPLPATHQSQSSTPTPIVITGVSRSGKTLLQSWLSVHPDIAAADEVGLLPKLAELGVGSDPAHLKAAGEQYRKTLTNLAGQARYVIDTHPTNAVYLDLLLQICPDAKVIQMQRDPLDLAVSIFARNFVTGGHWADTWQGIATRIQTYDRLQAHYANWNPVIATVSYETLVTDSQSVLTALSDALGLNGADVVMPPTADSSPATPRPLPWASFADRSAARSDSIGLWKVFAPWLGHFAEAYGRADLNGSDIIPSEGRAPNGTVVTALTSFRAGQTTSESSRPILEKVPAYHAALAHEAEQRGQWDEALAARWAAVSCRPFTHRVRHHADSLAQTINQSPDHQDLARLHKGIASRWATYREDSTMRFGDFGLPYQSFAPAMIAGSRDTEARVAAYDLEKLSAGKRVLDLGCNTGFLGLAIAPVANTVVGVEHEQALIDIGGLVQVFVGADNVTLQCDDATSYQSETPFDLVVAAAVHGWMAMPMADLGQRFADLTAPGGAVLFESQGQRSTTVVEAGFHDKVLEITKAGFDIERQGALCDDRVNKRVFVVLRKRN